MTYKKFFIIFLLILSIFSIFNFSSVHAENINVTSSSTARMQYDIDAFKQLLKINNINDIYDLEYYFGTYTPRTIQYVFIEGAGHRDVNYQYAYFYTNFNNITFNDNYNYYGIQQNSFTLHCNFCLRWSVSNDSFQKVDISSDNTFSAPNCWFGVKTFDLFTKDSSQIVANAVENVNKSVGDVNKSVGNVNNSINNLNDKITEDNSNQDDINLGTHNDEMNNASASIKNSNLYTKFNNIINKMDEAFSYDDDEPSMLLLDFNGKSFILTSDQISYFLKNNNLGFVILLWQSILWFSFFYTMFIFVRKLYKAVSGGNPVDEVSSTLSNEDNKIVGGF